MTNDPRRDADRRFYLIAAVQKRRQKAVAYKGGQCQICGYSKCVEALEFHHLNREGKDFGISAKGYTRSWKKVMQELD